MLGKVLLNPYYGQFLLRDKDRCIADGIELREEMLDWVFYFNDPMVTTCSGDVYRKALRALLALNGFTSVVSMRLNIEQKFLGECRRTFGLIFLGDICVADYTISFKAYNYDRQFLYINEWPKIDRKIVDAWTIDEWKDFFFRDIKNRAVSALNKEKLRIFDAQEKKSQAESVLRHIGKLPVPAEKISKKPSHETKL